MTSDQEPRYRLVDANGNIVGSLYGKPDGSVAIQETDSGADREVALAPDGTFSAPSVETESVSTDALELDSTYFYASDDDELDNILSMAPSGSTIYLGNSNFSRDRTIETQLSFVGSGRSAGTSLEGAEWTLDQRGIFISKIGNATSSTIINVEADRCMISQSYSSSSVAEINVNNDEFMALGLFRWSVSFAAGTSGGIVDSSAATAVSDDGGNTVGDIA